MLDGRLSLRVAFCISPRADSVWVFIAIVLHRVPWHPVPVPYECSTFVRVYILHRPERPGWAATTSRDHLTVVQLLVAGALEETANHAEAEAMCMLNANAKAVLSSRTWVWPRPTATAKTVPAIINEA